MTQTESPTGSGDTSIGDRIKLPLSFDAAELQAEVQGLALRDFIEYSVLPLTVPFQTQTEPIEDYADGSWAEWRETPLLESCPCLRSVVDTFRAHTDVTLVRLLRLAPGGHIKEHKDPTLGLQVERSVIRLHVPILTNDDVKFFLNGTLVCMQPGECWYLRLTDPHSVHNESSVERVHLSIDMVPNDWVRSLITSA